MVRVTAYMPTPGGLTGAPRRLLTLSSFLNKNGLDVCIASDPGSELLQIAEKLEYEIAEVDAVGLLALRQGALLGSGIRFRMRIFFDLLRQNWRLFRCFRTHQADVVWTRGSKGIAFGGVGALLSRRPLIWDVDYEPPSRGMVHWLHRFGLWVANAVIFQHQAAPDSIFGKELANRYQHKFTAIIPGVDLSVLDSFRTARECKNKGKNEPFKLLQVGTLCDRKNQMLLLDALHCLEPKVLGLKIHVQLAGGLSDSLYVERVLDAIKEKGLEEVVELLGWRDDVHELMVDADLLVMPSKDEGVPNTVQEAMYIGLPVMVSDVGGMPEVVKNSQTGWVLPLNDPDEWGREIRRCIEDREGIASIGKEASIYAAEYFGTMKWGRQYSSVMQSVL